MNSIIKMLLAVVVAVLLAVVPALAQQTCTADCNCDLSNIQLLNQVVETKINQTFADEPSMLFYMKSCYALGFSQSS